MLPKATQLVSGRASSQETSAQQMRREFVRAGRGVVSSEAANRAAAHVQKQPSSPGCWISELVELQQTNMPEAEEEVETIMIIKCMLSLSL